MFTAALFTIAKMCKQPNCSSRDEQLKKMWYTHIIYYSFIKKEKNLAIYSNMGRLEGNYSKGNNSDRERETLYDITYM